MLEDVINRFEAKGMYIPNWNYMFQRVSKDYGIEKAEFLAKFAENNLKADRISLICECLENTMALKDDEMLSEISKFLRKNKTHGDIEAMCCAINGITANAKEIIEDFMQFLKKHEKAEFIGHTVGNLAQIAGFLDNEKTLEIMEFLETKEKMYDSSLCIGKGGFFENKKEMTLKFYDFLKKYTDTKGIDHIAFCISALAGLTRDIETTNKVMSFFERNIDKRGIGYAGYAIGTIAFHSKDDALNALHLFEKYLGFDSELCRNDMHIGGFYLEELITGRAFDSLDKAENPNALMELIIRNDYSFIRLSIEDEDFNKKIGMKELELIEKTRKYIREMHKDRIKTYEFVLDAGFYEELNRAISQGDDFDSKSKYVRRYCREVVEKMNENILDLMVVNGG